MELDSIFESRNFSLPFRKKDEGDEGDFFSCCTMPDLSYLLTQKFEDQLPIGIEKDENIKNDDLKDFYYVCEAYWIGIQYLKLMCPPINFGDEIRMKEIYKANYEFLEYMANKGLIANNCPVGHPIENPKQNPFESSD